MDDWKPELMGMDGPIVAGLFIVILGFGGLVLADEPALISQALWVLATAAAIGFLVSGTREATRYGYRKGYAAAEADAKARRRHAEESRLEAERQEQAQEQARLRRALKVYQFIEANPGCDAQQLADQMVDEKKGEVRELRRWLVDAGHVESRREGSHLRHYPVDGAPFYLKNDSSNMS